MTPTLLVRPTPNSNVLGRGLVAGTLGAVIFLLFPGPALAADEPATNAPAEEKEEEEKRTYYAEMSAGPSFVPNQTLRGDGGAGGTLRGRVESSTGFYVSGAAGTSFLDDLLRFEIALSYREADVDRAGITSTSPPSDGNLSLFTLMANGYVDLDLGIGFIPYGGFGIGWGVVQFDLRRKVADEFEIDDTDSVFVYNAMVGARIPITEVTAVSLGYRYVATEDIRVQSTIEGNSQWMDTEFDAHEATIALRFNF